MRNSSVLSILCLITLGNRNGPPNFSKCNRPVRNWSACSSQTMLRTCCLLTSQPCVTQFRMSCKESWTLRGSQLCNLSTSETVLSSWSFSLSAERLTKRPGRCQPLTTMRLTKLFLVALICTIREASSLRSHRSASWGTILGWRPGWPVSKFNENQRQILNS